MKNESEKSMRHIRSCKILSIEQLSQLCMELEGKSVEESNTIARRYGINNDVYTRMLRTILGYTSKQTGYKTDDNLRQRIADLHYDGKTSYEIAAETGLSASGVVYVLKKMGVFVDSFHWKESEIKHFIACCNQYMSYKDMAQRLGRTMKEVCAMKQRLKAKGLVKDYPQNVRELRKKMSHNDDLYTRLRARMT